jgi:DNA-binding transcriptional ArsR family regulator
MDADLAAVAALIADPSRAAMLDALTGGGEPMTAGTLARIAGVAPSTATEHLTRLEQGGLVTSERRGRARQVRLAGPQVARALEALAAIAPLKRPAGLKAWQHGEAGALEPGEGAFAITAAGERELSGFGLDVGAIRGARRATARACIDWSERRPHVAGALGAALLDELLRRRWLRRRAAGPARTRTAARARRPCAHADGRRGGRPRLGVRDVACYDPHELHESLGRWPPCRACSRRCARPSGSSLSPSSPSSRSSPRSARSRRRMRSG